jgi:hypothetical protein
MTFAVVATLVLVTLGYFPARLLTGTKVAACLVSPLVTGLIVTVLGTGCVLLGLPMSVAIIGAVAVAGGSAVIVFRQRRTPGVGGSGDSLMVLLIPAGGLAAIATVRRAPVAWDARSIWWFHAKWFTQGGSAVADAMRNPAFSFSHPDYPPFAPATNAAAWLVDGTQSLKHAQIVTAVLTLSAITILGYAVWRLFADRLGLRIATSAGALIVAAAYGIARVDPATNGYVDVLWAAAFAAGALFLLAAPKSDDGLRWGAVMIAVAAVTKNEGLIAASIVVVLTAIRYGLHRRVVAWLGLGLAPGLAWLGTTRLLGVVSESADQSRTSRLLSLDPAVTSRFGPAVRSVGHQVSVVALAAAAVSIAGLVVAGPIRRRVSGTLTPWMWLAWLGTVGSLVFAYVVSSRPLAWHLQTSVARTTIAPNLLLLAEGAVWTLALAASVRDELRTRADAETDRPPIMIGAARHHPAAP